MINAIYKSPNTCPKKFNLDLARYLQREKDKYWNLDIFSIRVIVAECNNLLNTDRFFFT